MGADSTDNKVKDIQVRFANHNYSFSFFYTTYKNLCLEISSTKNLFVIDKKITAFIYSFSYAVPDPERQKGYWLRLGELKDKVLSDEELNRAMARDDVTAELSLLLYSRFYHYYLQYLVILSDFSEDLASTYMPSTNIQQKLLVFSNNNSFYENFMDYQKVVMSELGNFNILNFMTSLNTLITFYYAYYLFVTQKERIIIEKIYGLVLSALLNEDMIRLFMKNPSLSSEDKTLLRRIDRKVHLSMLLSVSIINSSFSNYGILPKITDKKYVDVTLI